ncbi:MAG: hypothetical protein JNM00_07780, partial [Flavobacteriales bacterium]|nr:hypothetical protein [Flavobacteriales bacterium]
HDAISGSLEITIKMFIDDLERSLDPDQQHPYHLADARETFAAGDSVRQYLSDHFSLLVNHRPTPIHYLGREYVGDMIYCYVEVPGIPDFEDLEVRTDLLCAQFPEQKNVVEVWAGGWKQTEICNCERQSVAFHK